MRRDLRSGVIGRLSSLTVATLLLCSACGGWQLKGSKAPSQAEGTNKELPKTLPQKPFKSVSKTDEASAVFLLDGKPMCFVGTNQYYLTWKSEEMIDHVFKNSKDIGVQVLRHWGHLEAGSLDGTVPHLKDDGTKEGVYFQYWDTESGAPAYNEGKDGLERLDFVVKKAQEANIRLVLTLTNNWPDFGGMDQYLIWYGLEKHHQFYTDERVKKAYKDWVHHLLNRVNTLTGIAYKDDPTIFAWELANEPRIRNYTKFDSPTGWDETTITTWATEMSEFIRSVDPHHMIAVGDEGMFSDGGKSFYDGSDGLDHKGLLRIPEIDYGTFHLYPDHWGTGYSWADTWIEDHIVEARKVGKPTVLEEYGVMIGRDEQTYEINYNWEVREKIYHQWNSLMRDRGGAGTMFWMIAGYDDYTKRNYTDWDHFTVYDYAGDPTARLLAEYGRNAQKDYRACQLPLNVEPKRQVPAGFVTTSKLVVAEAPSAAAGALAPVARLGGVSQ